MSNPSYERPKPKRGIYLLPNLFTISALFAGFYAVVAALKGSFDNAAIAIFIAMLMDSLDGRVARLTNTQTGFGAQLDSLSDMVSFGLAPALVIYSWSLASLGKAGWLAAFIYAVAVALRLARFNTQLHRSDKRYFRGLPCPAAAGIIAGLVWIGHFYLRLNDTASYMTGVATVVIGLLQVSNIRYRSFKDLNLKNRVSFKTMIAFAMILVFIAIDPPRVLFIIFLLYGLSGPVFAGWHWFRRHYYAK